MDLCYYNFKCKVVNGNVEDFGHIFSNVAYIISGVFFVVICYMRYPFNYCFKCLGEKP